MKTIINLLNALDKVETTTLQERIIKKDGMDAMLKTIKEAYGESIIDYKPGKGFIERNKKQST